MKFLIFLSFYSNLIFAMEIGHIIKSIDNINSEEALTIPKSIKYDIYDPFSNAKPILNIQNNRQKKQSNAFSPIILQTTLNERAFIDGKWYNAGDKVKGYKIKKINENSIIVVKNSKKKIIKIHHIINILKMKEAKK